MSDLDRLRSSLLSRYPETWVRHHLESFNEAYFDAFDESEVTRHLGMISELGDARPVFVRAQSVGPEEWLLEVVGLDAFQFLSTLTALLAVHGFSIIEGQVFTSRPPRGPEPPPRRPGVRTSGPPRVRMPKGPDRRRKIVDLFRVRRVDDQAGEPDWDGFQVELSSLLRLLREGRDDEVHHRLIGRFVAALGRHRTGPAMLEPLDLEIDRDRSEFATGVRIGARDSLGFLSLTASALSLSGIMIIQAEIHTGEGRVDDWLWVADRSGRKITSEAKLRELRLSLILIEHFSCYLHHAADPRAALVNFSRFVMETMARPEWADEFAAMDRPEVLDALVRVLGESEFLWEDYLHVQPENLLPLIRNPDEWSRRISLEEMTSRLDTDLSTTSNLGERCRVLRRFKDREIFRADVRSILGRCGGRDQFSAELSDVAELLLRAAYRIAEQELGSAAPRRDDGRIAPSALLALGKLGGRELGFASDLELMLVYDDRGLPDRDGSTGAGPYFDRFVAILREALAGRRGGTFEVDFRLRPYGRAGTPSTSLSTFAGYYQAGGPAWGYERQALTKLRAIAGDAELGREVEALRDRFVYGPEPFDLAGYRRMRQRQLNQLVRSGTVNSKFSPGGLVDVEYFVQALQITHGHRCPTVRTVNTLQTIAALGAAGYLSTGEVEVLRVGYEFYRALIDALRMVHGHAKDLAVPDARSEEFALLARRMRFTDPADLQDTLDARLRETRTLVDRLDEFVSRSPA